MAGFQACKFQDPVHSMAPVSDSLRATSIEVRQFLWSLSLSSPGRHSRNYWAGLYARKGGKTLRYFTLGFF